jgi:site-specific DNA recombinase
LIFELYTKKRLGARGVATFLSHHGYRSRPGQLWSHVSVLNVLRSPAYVGKIAFRDVQYDAPHPALVEADVFAKAQRLLRTRGEDASTRRSNTTEFLLSGLVVCAACDRRYVGTAAHGRTARYRYYTCFSRNRHGRQGCRSDVLRADLLDQAVLESLLATYADSEVVSAAIERWRSGMAKQGPDSASQVRRLEAEISGTESAVQRYYNAFENGRLPETRFAGRVDALERRLTGLRAKLEEVRDSANRVEAPSKKAVRDAEEALRDAMLNGTPGQRKALLKELIVDVRVESRDSIIPTFRLPTAAVRVTEAVVGRGGLEPPTSAGEDARLFLSENEPFLVVHVRDVMLRHRWGVVSRDSDAQSVTPCRYPAETARGLHRAHDVHLVVRIDLEDYVGEDCRFACPIDGQRLRRAVHDRERQRQMTDYRWVDRGEFDSDSFDSSQGAVLDSHAKPPTGTGLFG